MDVAFAARHGYSRCVSDVPREFRNRFSQHNRQSWIAAGLTLLAAWFAWMFCFLVFTGAVYLFETVRSGDVNLLKPPRWFGPVGIGLAVAMLVAAAVIRQVNRFKPPPDRPIIGWHLVPEVLTLPARLTYAIWDHVGERIVLGRGEIGGAWRLLQIIGTQGRADKAHLAFEFPDRWQLDRLLRALQLTNWIDLHRGDEGWFYRVRSDQEAELRTLLAPDSAFEEQPDG